MNRNPAGPSPESVARANRQRLARQEGAQAMADAEQKAVAVRKNMERLRALRQTKEAQEAVVEPAIPRARKKATRVVTPK